ncbi:hypothetical protein [Teredinibacter turnerae]|uniref:hypothetical protein n=1 Tax=Teredinibacter turnerae TaxID=2426 RepID=UPI0030D46906
MSTDVLFAFEGALIEMQCGKCSATQQLKVREIEPMLTRCHACKSLLMVEPLVRAKPNKIQIELFVTAVQSAVPVSAAEKTSLRAV